MWKKCCTFAVDFGTVRQGIAQESAHGLKAASTLKGI
jgi:hypothetical protein